MASLGGMQLRDGNIVGGSPGALPPAAAAAFARGAAAVLGRWTALRLAVEGEWGGPDSGAKAQRLLEDVVAWFGRGQDHFADDLEDELDEIMQSDFSADLQDDSPREVARALVALHAEMRAGVTATLDALLAAPPPPLTASLRHSVDRNGALVAATAAGGAASSSSSDDGDDGDDDTMCGGDDAPQGVPLTPARRAPPPAVDADGFTTVVRRKR